MKINLSKWLAYYSIPLVIFLLWVWITATNKVDPFFLPPPLKVLNTAVQSALSAEFLNDLKISLLRIISGFLIATVLAIPIGILMGRSRLMEALFIPPISFIRFVPMPAVIPLMILWFGSGDWGKAIIICLGVFFQLVLMIADVVKNIPREYLELAITMGASRWQRVKYFILPASYPGFLNSLRINFGLAWAILVFAEMLGATSGLGYSIIKSQRYLLVARVFFIIAVIGILGILVDFLLTILYRKLFPWAIQEVRAK